MKYSNAYFTAGILILFLVGQSYMASGQTVTIANHVVINEVELHPAGDDTKYPIQWVEIYNPTSTPVNIGGWKIGATTGLKQTYVIPTGTVIPSQQFIIYNYVPFWFPHAGAIVQLKDTTGTVVDQTPPLADQQGDGNTWQRIYDGYNTNSQNDWVFQSGTPGFSNGKPQTITITTPLSISISTDKQNYVFGDVVNIGGQVSKIMTNSAVSSIPQTVNLVLSGPNGFQKTFFLYPGNDLKFSTYTKTDKILGFAEGTYTISASYADIQRSTSFSLGSVSSASAPTIAPTTMYLTTDASNYTISQPIILQGAVSKIIPLTPIKYKVYDPTNVMVYQGTLFPDSDGKFTTVNQYQRSDSNSGILINSVNPTYGIYRIDATYGDTSAYVTFVLIQIQAQSQAIIVSTDKKVYAPGETVLISGRTKLAGLQNAALSPTLEIIQAYTTNETRSIPQSLHIKTFVNLQSDNSFTYQFPIPTGSSDRIGNYKVKISLPFGTADTDFAVSSNPSTYVSVKTVPFSMITDKSSYGYGDKLVISGQVETDLISGTGVQVNILIFDSNGSQIYSQANYLAGSIISQSTPLTFAVLPDVNGYYSITQNITPNIFKEGTYTLKANYGNNLKTSTSFTVSNLLGTSSSGQIVANTDKKVYDVGGIVKLNGTLSSSASMDSYTLTLIKPTGNQITFPLQVNNGQFSWTWTIPKADTTGSAITSTDRSSSSVLDPTITVYGIYRIKISSTHTNADLFFQVSKNPQPDQSMSPIVVQTDKTDYVSTDVAKIWGQVIPIINTATQEANSLVQVSIYSDNGQQVYRGDATVNQGGQFYITIPFHTGIWKTGTYKLYAEYLTNKIITSFKVTDPFSTSSAKLQLFITTDAEKYLPGQTVLITGRTSYIVSVDNVDLTFGLKNDTLISEGEVTSKKGNILPKATVSFDQFGSFSYDYKIPDNTRLGSYTIVAQVPFGAYSAYFDVVNKLPVKETPFTNMTQVTQNNVIQTIPQSTQTVAPSTIGPISQHVMSANTFVEKINKISDSTITIPLNSKSVGNGTYYPRELDGLLRVNPGDENYVGMKLSSQDGTCIIGQDSSCLVTTSTIHSGMLYQTVKIGSKNFLVGYSGGGIRLQQFSIIPESTSDLIPAGQWNVNAIKKDQVTRFYYHLLYVEK